MTDLVEERRKAVALFCHGVIAAILCEPPERAGELVRLQSGKASVRGFCLHAYRLQVSLLPAGYRYGVKLRTTPTGL